MAIEVAPSYERISSKAYEHPADKAATSALHSVPLLDTVVKRLTDLGHERRLRQIVMGNAIRLGPEQVPAVWATYVRCCSVLDLDEVPDLYVVNDPAINAMTIGAKKPIVIVNSSMLRSFDEKEVETVLAHETAHVLSEHYTYTTALVLLEPVPPRRPAALAPPRAPGPRHVPGAPGMVPRRRALGRPRRGARHGATRSNPAAC